MGSNFSNDDLELSIGNSNYNSFQASLRHTGKRTSIFMSAYTYSKSIDHASSISDPVNPFNFRATRALSALDLKHNVVATYVYQLPFERLFHGPRALTEGWAISGITRISTGFPVTISSDGDNSLDGKPPQRREQQESRFARLCIPAIFSLNRNPRNGLAYFNTSLFSPNALGTPGTASRRSFYGPGSFNSDIALLKNVRFSEEKTLEFRLETFNTFNHTQFFGPAAVNGDIDSDLFGQVVKAAPPRLMQLAVKFTF